MATLIALLRFIAGQTYTTAVKIASVIIVYTEILKVILNVTSWLKTYGSIWTKLWEDSDFHSVIAALAIFKAGNPSILFIMIFFGKFFLRLCRLIVKKVVGHLGEYSYTLREYMLLTLKHEGIRHCIAAMEIILCPYMFLTACESMNIGMFMASFVCAFVYLPHMYLANRSHRFLWRHINVLYTQIALSKAHNGDVMVKVLNAFSEFVDLCFIIYPEKYVRRMQLAFE